MSGCDFARRDATLVRWLFVKIARRVFDLDIGTLDAFIFGSCIRIGKMLLIECFKYVMLMVIDSMEVNSDM